MFKINRQNFVFFVSVALLMVLLPLILIFQYDPLKIFRARDSSGNPVYGVDYKASYYASKRLGTDDSLYFKDKQSSHYPEEIEGLEGYSGFVYVPISAYILWPLSTFEFPNSYIFITIISYLLIFLSLLILGKALWKNKNNNLTYIRWGIFFILSSSITWTLIERGQTDALIFFFLVLCYSFFVKNMPVLSGLFLALSALFKLTPLIFFPYFFFKERKIFYYASCFFAIGLFITGIQNLMEFAETLSVFSAQVYSTSYFNFGLFGLAYGLIKNVVPQELAKTLYFWSVGLTTILFFFRFGPIITKTPKSTQNILLDFGLLTSTMIILPMVSWSYHGIHLIFIFSAYWYFRSQDIFSKKIIFIMDLLFFLIVSEIGLFYQMQVKPYSYILGLRPLYILAFSTIIIFKYKDITKHQTISEKVGI